MGAITQVFLFLNVLPYLQVTIRTPSLIYRVGIRLYGCDRSVVGLYQPAFKLSGANQLQPLLGIGRRKQRDSCSQNYWQEQYYILVDQALGQKRAD